MYDDREVITTNLIECYDKAMAFIEKHLPDKFYLENDQRISLRNIIFRELIANILVHKEYLGAEPTKLVIEKNRIYTENSNKPYINGLVDLSNLKAHPKNPNISRLFREIGRVEELGSGVTKLFKYSKHYFDSLPILEDYNLFKVNIQTDLMMSSESDTVESDTVESNTVESDTVEEKKKRNVDEELMKDILNFCKSPQKSADIARFANYKNKRNFIIKFLNPMIEKGLLKRTYPNSLNSPHQKYETVIKN